MGKDPSPIPEVEDNAYSNQRKSSSSNKDRKVHALSPSVNLEFKGIVSTKKVLEKSVNSQAASFASPRGVLTDSRGRSGQNNQNRP